LSEHTPRPATCLIDWFSYLFYFYTRLFLFLIPHPVAGFNLASQVILSKAFKFKERLWLDFYCINL
jgi:hypothetical protein